MQQLTALIVKFLFVPYSCLFVIPTICHIRRWKQLVCQFGNVENVVFSWNYPVALFTNNGNLAIVMNDELSRHGLVESCVLFLVKVDAKSHHLSRQKWFE